MTLEEMIEKLNSIEKLEERIESLESKLEKAELERQNPFLNKNPCLITAAAKAI